MIRAIADAHAVIWYGRDDPRLSVTARTFIEDAARAGDEIGVATITIVEMVYLVERSRIDATTLHRLIADLNSPDTVLVEVPLNTVIAQTMQRVDRHEIPEMGD